MKNSSKIYLKPIGGSDSNIFATAITILAVLEWISSAILFFVFIENIAVAAGIFATGIISGIFIFGFGEIIRLLQLKQTQEYEIITEDGVGNQLLKDKVVNAESVKVNLVKETTNNEPVHKTPECVNDGNKEETDHIKIIFKIAEMSNIKDVHGYMVGYIGYKDETFRKMLSIAYDMAKSSGESSDDTSIGEVRAFLAMYRAEVANK